MRRSSRARIVVAIGALMLAAAAVMAASGVFDDLRATHASATVLNQLNEQRPEPRAADAAARLSASRNPNANCYVEDASMPAVTIGSYDYIGSIAIPVLGIDLPVASETDDERLRISPCRYQGSYLTSDLIICGQGYAGHFGMIGTLGIRDEVRFVAADGTMYHYIVSNVETDRLEDIDAIIHDWDLTLFTFGANDTVRVVRCVRM